MNQSSDSRPTWNGLPDVAVRKIFGQLKAGDRARLMVVSKSWKRILCRDDLPTVPELWRLCSPPSYVTHVKLTSTSEGYKKYSFKLPQFCKDSCGGWLCGSSGGWLLVASGPEFKQDLYLWNPLNDVVMTLPRLSTTLPRISELGPEEYSISSYIKRVVVFSKQCVVAVVLRHPDDDGEQDILAMCTPKDRKWMIFEEGHVHTLSDILFHDGRLYVLAKHMMTDKDKKSTKYTTKICLSKCQVEICVLGLAYKADDTDALWDGSLCFDEDVASNPLFNITYGDKISEHLVEFSGQLLFIAIFYDLYAYNSNGDGPVKTFRCHGIQRMDVRKVDGMEKIESLGDERIIALADTGSFTVPPSAIYQGAHDSGIRFTTQYARGYADDEDEDGENQCVALEYGFVHLETGQFRKYGVQYYTQPFINGWHTPKLF